MFESDELVGEIKRRQKLDANTKHFRDEIRFFLDSLKEGYPAEVLIVGAFTAGVESAYETLMDEEDLDAYIDARLECLRGLKTLTELEVQLEPDDPELLRRTDGV